MRRSFVPPLLVLSLLVGGAGCGAQPEGLSLTLRDPKNLGDVTSDLRLLVFPTEARSCTAAGTLSPALSDERDAVFEDALVDIRFATGESASVDLDVGNYTVHLRGRGTDRVSMIPDSVVAVGCAADVAIAAGETKDLDLELKSQTGSGVCGDGLLSPDEQCEGDVNCTDCRTTAFVTHTTTMGTQSAPSLGWGSGSRLVIGFDDASVSPRKVRFMVRGESGELVESPAALALDAIADVDATLGGAQSTTAVASSPNRIAVALVDPSSAATEGGDVLVRFFDQNRSAEGPPVRCTDAQTGAQTEPAVALTSGGAAMVVFADSAAGGVTARHFANGSTTPSGGEVVVGSGASAPDVAAHASGFVVALQVGGNIMFQRFQENGSPVDAAPQMVGTGSAPRVAALADGRFMIAWNDGGVVARAFGADGTPSTDKLTVASGDNVDVAAGAERFLVSFLSGTVMARVYDGAGELALNHESPPSTDAFMVGSGTDPVAAGGRDFIAVGFAAGGDISARLFPVP